MSGAEIFLVVIVLKIQVFYCQDYNTSHDSDCPLMAVVANHATTELSDKHTMFQLLFSIAISLSVDCCMLFLQKLISGINRHPPWHTLK